MTGSPTSSETSGAGAAAAGPEAPFAPAGAVTPWARAPGPGVWAISANSVYDEQPSWRSAWPSCFRAARSWRRPANSEPSQAAVARSTASWHASISSISAGAGVCTVAPAAAGVGGSGTEAGAAAAAGAADAGAEGAPVGRRSSIDDGPSGPSSATGAKELTAV